MLNFSSIHKFKEQHYTIITEKSPLAALLLIPVTIISGAYWTSIPFYLVIATLWLFQRKSSIPWESGITLMGSCLLAIFIASKTDYAFWIYTIKIIGCFVIVVSLRPAIQNQQRFWIDTFLFLFCGSFGKQTHTFTEAVGHLILVTVIIQIGLQFTVFCLQCLLCDGGYP